MPFSRAKASGFGHLFPESVMEYDGHWCYFYRNGQIVWGCNPVYAKANFNLTEIK